MSNGPAGKPAGDAEAASNSRDALRLRKYIGVVVVETALLDAISGERSQIFRRPGHAYHR